MQDMRLPYRKRRCVAPPCAPLQSTHACTEFVPAGNGAHHPGCFAVPECSRVHARTARTCQQISNATHGQGCCCRIGRQVRTRHASASSNTSTGPNTTASLTAFPHGHADNCTAAPTTHNHTVASSACQICSTVLASTTKVADFQHNTSSIYPPYGRFAAGFTTYAWRCQCRVSATASLSNTS